MSKKDQAQKIYNDNVSTRTRPEIIKIFMEELNMSQAGASTYFANCRSAANNGDQSINMKKVIKRVESIAQALQNVLDDSTDKESVSPTFHICTVVDDTIQDDEIGSFFDEQIAKRSLKPHQRLLCGCYVEIGDRVPS